MRRERHRRLRNASCTRNPPQTTRQVFDQIEYLDQRLNYALPDSTFSHAIVTTDRYLGYTLSRYLFSGKHAAVFNTFEPTALGPERSPLRQLVIDMEGLAISRYEALEHLRLFTRERNNIHIYFLVSGKDASLIQFMRMAGNFQILSRHQDLPSLRKALLFPPEGFLQSDAFSHTDWKIISALSQGASLKTIARLQNTPYHRVIYRINRLTTQLGLPHRQSLLHLIHRLSVTSPHLI
ncbi:fimbriae Y protein [Citrobacter sp. Awk 4]|uniref:fimbria biosynthesis regulator FimY n=1 Tax=Citrobacter sp. Awk 4 TaxID=2963955 RepID=UPI002304B1A6|nr:fimbriae Y protein [Citrobacter sp. Awk 4]MDA8477594.1 fimbriae Y protein [Citrobacter sp. Awk 4]